MLLKMSLAALTVGFVYKNMTSRTEMTPECTRFSDKHIEAAVAKIDEGIKHLQEKYPTIKRPNLSYGLRGVRYYIEFPIIGRNVDAFSILVAA
jgi:hypothetical protein